MPLLAEPSLTLIAAAEGPRSVPSRSKGLRFRSAEKDPLMVMRGTLEDGISTRELSRRSRSWLFAGTGLLIVSIPLLSSPSRKEGLLERDAILVRWRAIS